MKLATQSPPDLAEALGAGKYTTITEIVAPASASAGSRVDITVKIKNTYTSTIGIMVGGALEYGVSPWPSITFPDNWANVPSGQTYSFNGYFTMPSAKVKIHAYSYYYADTWYFDDEKTKDVSLAEVWQKLGTRSVTITPIEMWQKLGTRSVTITPIEMWQKLGTRSVTITPTEVWQKLAAEDITITPTEVWQKLAYQNVTITPVELPPGFELLEETIYHYAYIYEGPHDGGIFTFKSDPFTPADWISGKVATHLEDEVRKAGGKMLEMRVYVDKSPLLWSDWRIEVITVPPKTTGVAFGPWWVGPLLLVLAAIALIIVGTWAVLKIFDAIFPRKPGLADMKPTWKKEALILDIQDSEEYFERTPTPVETLEDMSEEELRHLLNQIAEEEIVPPAEPGLGLAFVALGILGLGALAVGAMAMGRPAEGPAK